MANFHLLNGRQLRLSYQESGEFSRHGNFANQTRKLGVLGVLGGEKNLRSVREEENIRDIHHSHIRASWNDAGQKWYNWLVDLMENCTMSVYELLEKAKTLDHSQQIELIKLLVDHLAGQPAKPKRSLRELRGLGKEIWQGIDAQEYINELRAEWKERDR